MSLHEPNTYRTKSRRNRAPLPVRARSSSPFEHAGRSSYGLSLQKPRRDLHASAENTGPMSREASPQRSVSSKSLLYLGQQTEDLNVECPFAKPKIWEEPASPLTSLVRRHVQQQAAVATVHSILEPPQNFSSRPSSEQRPRSLPPVATRSSHLQRALSTEEVDDRSQRAVDWFHKVHHANAQARPIEDITAKLATARLKRQASLDENGSNSAGPISAGSTSGSSQQKSAAMARLSAAAKNWDSYGAGLGGPTKPKPPKPPLAPQPKKVPSFLRDPFFQPKTPTSPHVRRNTVE